MKFRNSKRLILAFSSLLIFVFGIPPFITIVENYLFHIPDSWYEVFVYMWDANLIWFLYEIIKKIPGFNLSNFLMVVGGHRQSSSIDPISGPWMSDDSSNTWSDSNIRLTSGTWMSDYSSNAWSFCYEKI